MLLIPHIKPNTPKASEKCLEVLLSAVRSKTTSGKSYPSEINYNSRCNDAKLVICFRF